ncbi:DUF7305 domain-containing protein [Halosegnis marinus]|uniref:DUF7305 domain-containing protein n=1 Tax=Halosegnis marinus TaxID=3034023 RepID=UPI0036182094
MWRDPAGGPVGMVTPPEFHFEGRTLTVPVVSVAADDDPERLPSGRLAVSAAGSRSVFPNATLGRTNPVPSERVRVSVRSDYYEAWAAYFERHVGGVVEADDANRTATVVLVTEASGNASFGIGGSGGTSIRLAGRGGADAFVDSYDSDERSYAATSDADRADGRIVAAGDVKVTGGAVVRGDVVIPSDGCVTTTGARGRGRGGAGADSCTDGGDAVTGEVVRRNVSLTLPQGRVAARVASLRGDNDNGAALDDGSLAGDTLTAGEYYAEEMTLDGETLTFDVSDGDVTLAINGDVTLDRSDVEVTGSGGTVRLYVNGNRFEMRDATVSVPGDRAERFWVYGTPDLVGEMRGSELTGVFYAPAAEGEDTFRMRQSEVFGAVATADPNLRAGSTVHYDEALRDEPVYTTRATLVSYLHVSVNEVEVEERSGARTPRAPRGRRAAASRTRTRRLPRRGRSPSRFATAPARRSSRPTPAPATAR